MNISRHNYEEFFLLYVDNELSAAERKAVDVFVQENPDLQGELLLLQQTIIKTDDIVLEKKDWLFMEEGASALQENLLLYADDELSVPDKRTVEALLATDKTAAAEWSILRQTKLQADTDIVFADKQSLYKTEGGRVVGFKWWRAAAAAVLLGFVLWTGVAVYENNFKPTTGNEGIAKDAKTKPAEIKTDETKNSIAVDVQPKDNITPLQTVATTVQNNIKEQLPQKAEQFDKKTNKQNTIAPKDNIAVQNKNEKPSNNLPKPYFENFNRKESNEMVGSTVLPEKSNNISGSGINDVIVKTNPVIADVNKSDAGSITTAIPVVNRTSDESNSRFLDIDEAKGKRTMLGGLIRKAKRMVERTTNIKTGDGLKVAGFEIALK